MKGITRKMLSAFLVGSGASASEPQSALLMGHLKMPS